MVHIHMHIEDVLVLHISISFPNLSSALNNSLFTKLARIIPYFAYCVNMFLAQHIKIFYKRPAACRRTFMENF